MLNFSIKEPLTQDGRIYLGSVEEDTKSYPVLFRGITEDQRFIYTHIQALQTAGAIAQDLIPKVYAIINKIPDIPTHKFTVIQEFINGVSLYAYTKDKPLPTSQAAYLTLILARDVASYHAAGLLHGDIKRENIILATEKHCAIFIDNDMTTVFQSSIMSPAKGYSPHYACLEQMQGLIGPKTDLRCLAITLLETILGSHPFEHIISSHSNPLSIAGIVSSHSLDASPHDHPLITLLCSATHSEYGKRPNLNHIINTLQRYPEAFS